VTISRHAIDLNRICLFIVIVITHRRFSIISNSGGLKLTPQGIPGHLVWGGGVSKQLEGFNPQHAGNLNTDYSDMLTSACNAEPEPSNGKWHVEFSDFFSNNDLEFFTKLQFETRRFYRFEIAVIRA
jgi:hypothetical protein